MKPSLLVLLVLGTAFLLPGSALSATDSWRKGPTSTSTEATSLQGGSCVYLILTPEALLNDFAPVLGTSAGILSVSLDPDTASAALGAQATLWRCDAGASVANENVCSPVYFDSDGDGALNQTPLTGAIGNTGFASIAPAAFTIRVNGLPPATGLVTVCGR